MWALVIDPAEVRLDLALAAVHERSWVLVEVQLDEDEVKARKWTLAVAAVWNERGVPGDLVVITADRAVAAWARSVGTMAGPSGTSLMLRPVVVQLTGDVAEMFLDSARPELAFFAAWTVHDRYGPGAQAIVERATDLIETLPDEALRRSLLRHILGMLHEKLLRHVREVSMDSQKIPVSPALQRLFEEFKSMDGERHEARGEAKMLIKILAARGVSLDEDARARILECTDTAELERWAERAANATSIEQVFDE